MRERITRYQWTVLFVAWLGWVFDIMDTALFNFAKGPMMKEFLGGEAAYKQIGPQIEGRLQFWFLVGWACGGLIFGVLADRWGRTRTMVVTILLYCLFTGLTALCQTPEQVAVVRFLTALGIGGEWAAGAALIAEAFPDWARPKAAALLQTAAAFGPAFAGLANMAVPAAHWRWLFVIGIAPALVTVLIRAYIKEPERAPRAEKPDFWSPVKELFAEAKWRKRAAVALLLGVVGIAGAQNVAFWLPNLVEAVSQGLTPDQIQWRKSIATYTFHIGTLAGVLAVPWLCGKIGRKKAILAFFVLAPISILAATFGGNDFGRLLLVSPLMSLFAIGVSGAFVLYFPELFPSRLRATGAGFAYNTGRIVTAFVPLYTGWLTGQMGGVVINAVLVTAVTLLAIGLIAIPFAPETKGQPLPE